MNINRHNYESFFMLYIDNELSGEEKQAVDNFVKENVDLKVDLEALQLSVLQDEECYYGNKEQLLKKEIISPELETQLLLLLDEELTQEEAIVLKDSISKDVALTKEWKLLQETQLLNSEDELVFENKELLYRREEKVRPFYLIVRWAAAAALIGIGFYTGLRMLNKNETALPEAVAVENSVKPTNSLPQTNTTDLNKVENVVQDNLAVVNNKVEENKALKANFTAANKTVQKESITQEKYKNLASEINNSANNETQILLASNTAKVKTKNYAALDVSPEVTTILPAKRPEIIDINIMEAPTNNQAIATAFKGNNDADRILYMDKEVVEKTRVGKFLKNLKNTLSGDVEIKTGRTIKIAGFEIAMQ